jgi:acyl-CoA reductase-like NAD-dependent aldehyde dehydrogenase
MGSIAYALAAGNAVVFKPSEYSPAVGSWLVETFAEISEEPVLQIVTGYGETGAALCRAGVGKISFTGSTATAKRVMAACAETLTPVLIEAGGKDAAIVAADADLDLAADAVAFGAFGNAGQTCVGIERAYVVASAYDAFVDKVSELANRLTVGVQLGPITMPSQVPVIQRHIEDALSRGGRAVVGGVGSVRAPYVEPVVLVGVPEDSEAIQEETFGPTLTITKVADLDEAIDKANGSRYGLGSAVISRSRRTAIGVARRLRAGMTCSVSCTAPAGSNDRMVRPGSSRSGQRSWCAQLGRGSHWVAGHRVRRTSPPTHRAPSGSGTGRHRRLR